LGRKESFSTATSRLRSKPLNERNRLLSNSYGLSEIRLLLFGLQEACLWAFSQEMNNGRQIRIERGLTVAGVTLWVIIVCSWLVLLNSHYHTLRREAALDASNVTAWLEIAWILAAAILAVVRWRLTSLKFRIVLLLNGLVVSILLAGLYSATRGLIGGRLA